MIKQFVSPNLKYNNGKIYYLNKSEINNKNHNYVHENYFYYLSEINKDFDDCSIELVVNDYSDDSILFAITVMFHQCCCFLFFPAHPILLLVGCCKNLMKHNVPKLPCLTSIFQSSPHHFSVSKSPLEQIQNFKKVACKVNRVQKKVR